jgi:hypothetical protein
MVKRALQIAEKTLAEQARAQTRGAAPQATTVATAGAGRAATMTAQAPLVSTTYAATRTVGAQPTTSQPLGRYRP